MNALVSFIMRGPLQAILLVVVTATLSLILPPVSVIAAAIVALVTLRKGALPGLVVLGGAGLVLGVFTYFAMANAGLMLAFLTSILVTVIPVWILAIVLRSTISLAVTMTVAVVFGCCMVLVAHVALDNPAVWWEEILSGALPTLGEGMPQGQGFNFAESIKAMSVWMTGMVAAAMTISYVASLLIARWAQALLYNPGGFKQEFMGLRLDKKLAVAALITIVLAFVGGDALGSVAKDLLWVFGAVFAAPGLSVVHHWIGKTSKPTIWLAVTYVLLLFIPHVVVLMALIGLVDTWVSLRAPLSGNRAA